MKLKDRLGAKIVEVCSGEVISSDPTAVFFEEEDRVEMVELDLTEFVGH